jgi:hypothetical protein
MSSVCNQVEIFGVIITFQEVFSFHSLIPFNLCGEAPSLKVGALGAGGVLW